MPGNLSVFSDNIDYPMMSLTMFTRKMLSLRGTIVWVIPMITLGTMTFVLSVQNLIDSATHRANSASEWLPTRVSIRRENPLREESRLTRTIWTLDSFYPEGVENLRFDPRLRRPVIASNTRGDILF